MLTSYEEAKVLAKYHAENLQFELNHCQQMIEGGALAKLEEDITWAAKAMIDAKNNPQSEGFATIKNCAVINAHISAALAKHVYDVQQNIEKRYYELSDTVKLTA